MAVKEEEQREMTEKKTVSIGNRGEYFLYPVGFSWNSECTLRNSFLLELGTWLLPYHALPSKYLGIYMKWIPS